ncbi:MAG: DinB family protein [Gemmatimonadaceae bacterium]
MSTQDLESLREVELLRQQAGMVRQVLHMNTEGITQAESLIQPQAAGNCMNWVVGHLLAIYHHVLPLLGQEPVLPVAQLSRYDRGSAPIQDMSESLDINDMLKAWDETCARIDAGFAVLTRDQLDSPAPMSPTNNPKETIGSLLGTVCWHQAYHAGQAGLLRRLAGKEGAIR